MTFPQPFTRMCPPLEVSIPRQIWAHFCFCCCSASFWLTLAFPVQAAEKSFPGHSSESAILLVESKRDDARGFEDLREALEAHLGSNEIVVRLHRIHKLPRRPSAQAAIIRDLARELNISAAMWIDIPRQTMSLLFTDQEGNERILQRKFSCIKQNMRECGDAMGSKVTSALSSWIGWKYAPAPEVPPAASPVEDNELSPIDLGDTPWTEPRPLVRLLLEGGYGFSFFRGTAGFTHGTRLGVGTVWWDYLKFHVSTDILFPLEQDSELLGNRVEINRLPIRILAGGVLPLGRWTVSLTLGLAIDLMSFREVSSHPFFDGVDYVNYGFSANVAARFYLESWFAVWLGADLDLYGSEFVTSRHGQTSLAEDLALEAPLRCGKAFATLALGIAFTWSFYGNTVE